MDRGTRLLLAATLVNGLGYQIFVPIPPLYLRSLGASPQSIFSSVAVVGVACLVAVPFLSGPRTVFRYSGLS